jgi:hypothetical protein
MGNKIIDSIIEWLKDEDSGDVVGYKRKDGTERGIVTSEVNPLTGGSSLLAAGVDVLSNVGPRVRNGMWRGAGLSQWQTTYAGYVWRLALEIPCHARAFRVSFPKHATGSWTVDGLAICATDVATTPARFQPGSGSAWVAGTFDGALAPKTIPAFSVPDQYQAGSAGDCVWSDWIACPTIPRADNAANNPMVVISVLSSSTNICTVNGGAGSSTGFESQPMHRYEAFKTGIAVDGSFSSCAYPQCIPILDVQWAPTVPSLSIGGFGDSIMRGEKTTPLSNGYVIKAAATMTANSGYSVSSVNAGFGGDRVISFLNRFRLLCQSGGGLPNIALFPLYSRNSVSVMSVGQMEGIAESFIRLCRKYGVLPALVSAIPESATPANNATATAANALAQAMATFYNIPFINNAAVITSANMASYLDVDGIHPNDAGNDLLGVACGNALLPWIPAALSLQMA